MNPETILLSELVSLLWDVPWQDYNFRKQYYVIRTIREYFNSPERASNIPETLLQNLEGLLAYVEHETQD